MKKQLRGLLFVIFLGMILFGLWELLGIWRTYAGSRKEYDQMAQDYAVTVPAVKETEPESTGSTEETEPKEYAPIQVDFDTIRMRWDEVIGWLYCEGTPINYPVLHHSDNDYYMDRLPDGSYSFGGSIFLDAANLPDFSDSNSILYGHNMNDDSMFGSFDHYRKQSYYDDHPVMYLLTPEKDYKVILIGGYVTDSDSDTYNNPTDQEGWQALVDKAVVRSVFVPQTAAEPGQKLVTLSTCAYENDEWRLVLIGALQELDTRDRGSTDADAAEILG